MQKRLSPRRRAYAGLMRTLMGIATVLTCALTVFLIAYVLIRGLPNVTWKLLST